MLTAQIIPADTLFDEALREATARGMHLISNGRSLVFSPVIPAGWTKISVKVIDRSAARLEPQACAA